MAGSGVVVQVEATSDEMKPKLESSHSSDLHLRFKDAPNSPKKKNGEKKLTASERGEVCLGVRLYSLQVDHTNSTFDASFRIFYDWCDLKLAAKIKEQSDGDFSWDSVPEVQFENAIKYEEWQNEEWQKKPRVIDEQTGRLYAHRKYEGTFSEYQNTKQFPFDVQEMKVSVQLSNSAFRGIYVLRLLPLEFSGVPPIVGYYLMPPRCREHPLAKEEKPKLSITFEVARQSGFFIRNLLVWLGLFTTISFASCTSPASDATPRAHPKV